MLICFTDLISEGRTGCESLGRYQTIRLIRRWYECFLCFFLFPLLEHVLLKTNHRSALHTSNFTSESCPAAEGHSIEPPRLPTVINMLANLHRPSEDVGWQQGEYRRIFSWKNGASFFKSCEVCPFRSCWYPVHPGKLTGHMGEALIRLQCTIRAVSGVKFNFYKYTF